MNRKLTIVGAVALLMVLALGASTAWAQDNTKPPCNYTLAEYNTYKAAAEEGAAQQRVKLLDDFVAKYPNSCLSIYIWRPYYLGYYELKNYPKAIEYTDKLLALGEKMDQGSRLEALAARAQAFFFGSNLKALLTPEQLTKTQEASAEGLKTLEQWKKPEALTDDQYAAQKKSLSILFYSIGGLAALQAKDYNAAIPSLQAALALNPDGITYYRLGFAYVQQDPPQYMEGFWVLARSIALKGPNQAQVRAYLRNQVYRYQQPACDSLLDSQVKELLALAAASPERPAGYNIPSAADLTKAREGVATFIDDLKTGGDKAKLVWFAVCGLEFPDVAVKVIDVIPAESGDSVLIKAFRGDTQEIMEAAKEPNMEIKVEGQPEAKRIEKDMYVRVTGTLSGYQPDPFLIFWDKAKVNAEDIPEAKPEPAKKAPVKKAPAKKKAPTKKPPQ